MLAGFVTIFLQASVADPFRAVPASPGHRLPSLGALITDSVPAVTAVMNPDSCVVKFDVADEAVDAVFVSDPVVGVGGVLDGPYDRLHEAGDDGEGPCHSLANPPGLGVSRVTRQSI